MPNMTALPSPDLRPLIFIVDDDEAVRNALILLANARGWNVLAFDSAEDFLARAPEQADGRPMCLVLDLQMPGMSGAELQERLQRRDHRLPTLILSAWPDGHLARRALAAGACAVIGKPFAPSQWLEIVERLLERG